MNTRFVDEAVKSIRSISDFQPRVGVVLGSGFGELVSDIKTVASIAFKDITHFCRTSVEGHAGFLVMGSAGQTPVAVLQGRVHLYEGYSYDDVVRPVQVLARLGVRTMVLTSAAGGINAAFNPGDLMVITDHLNLQWGNPLVGQNDDTLGPRFPDMTEVYDKCLSVWLMECAKQEGVAVHQGVYAGVLGPSYETPAEIRMLRTLGADAVGMSVVAEAIAARHSGLRVCGLSLITNYAAGLKGKVLTHDEVMASAERAKGYFGRLMKRVLANMPLEKRS